MKTRKRTSFNGDGSGGSCSLKQMKRRRKIDQLSSQPSPLFLGLTTSPSLSWIQADIISSRISSILCIGKHVYCSLGSASFRCCDFAFWVCSSSNFCVCLSTYTLQFNYTVSLTRIQ
jgi:hypothetical protein